MTLTSQEVPLPEPGLIYMGLTGNPEHAFSAAQMLAYATARTAAMTALAERLKLEAQTHAMEARTANATIAEIYQVVTGSTGEPGNWNGAKPVREAFAALEERVKALEADAARYLRLRENWIDCDELGLHGRTVVIDEAVDKAIAKCSRKADSTNAACDKDAARAAYLRERFLGADFAWGEPACCVLVFKMDPDIKVFGDFNLTIDTARGEGGERG